MKRRIIKIDENRCDGCGLCAEACHEGAIGMVDGKARLLRDDYCDGLGDCLPACPQNAISFEEREAAAYDQKAVEEAQRKRKEAQSPCAHGHFQCPSSNPISQKSTSNAQNQAASVQNQAESQLAQWPVQIKLVPTSAPFFEGANLLVAADCSAFACGDFHERFMKNHVTLIGCPKLDGVDYTAKLAEIIKNNDIKSLKIVRMSVPCCGGIENAAKAALQSSGKFIPWQVYTLTTTGKIID